VELRWTDGWISDLEIDMKRWFGCYGDSWKGVITDASFAHPAKFSKRLVQRILDYMAEQGWIKQGDVIGDPFAGVGCGGIVAAYRGYRWVGVELERKFFYLARDNFNKHRSKLGSMLGVHLPVIVLGDSRKFDQQVHAILSSPPYVSGGHHTDVFHGGNREKRRGQGILEGYGRAEGQIATLKSGEVDSVVTSCPFTQTKGGAKGINVKGYEGKGRRDVNLGKRTYQGEGGDREADNIEVLKSGSVEAVITSPPYETISAGAGGLNHLPARGKQQSGRKKGASQNADQTYGKTPGQIAHAKKAPVDAVISSPPYEGQEMSGTRRALEEYDRTGKHAKRDYGTTAGQIGAAKGETYWQAMAKVYHACLVSLKPGGVMAIIVKDFVKNSKRMLLCDDTMRLLVWLGFEEIERIHAMLSEEQVEADLFEGSRTKRTEKKSFFRRLHESRLPKDDPRRIDFEEVLFVRKPL
jgi:DNA modification methylase